MVANQLSTRLNKSSSPPKVKLASRCARRTRSATPSIYRSEPSPPVPKGLSADPPGLGSYLRGSVRRHGPAPQCLTAWPKAGVPIAENREKETEYANPSSPVDLTDGIPTELARMVVNMQEYYASGVEELTGKLDRVKDELIQTKEENREMERRLNMHFVMLRQAAEFMQRISESREALSCDAVRRKVMEAGGVERAVVPTLAEVGGVPDGRLAGLAGDDGDGFPRGTVDMELPPTPVVDREPVMSTGRKASRRRGGQGKCPSSTLSKRMRLLTRRRRRRRRRRRAASPKGSNGRSGGGICAKEASASPLAALPEEGNHQGGGGDWRGGEHDGDGMEILKGAPRLRALLRRSAWTAINNRPARRSSSAVEADPSEDEEEPLSRPSPSIASPSPSLYEEASSNARSKSPPSPSSPSPSPSSSPPRRFHLGPQPSRPRYSSPRRTTTPRYASGPPARPFRFHRMGRTVLDVWREYKLGSRGNPAIEALELEFGTGWRAGSLREVKYASNYVGVRQKVVNQVEEMCERDGLSAEEACRRLDERVDGRMQMLISAVRRGEDPFRVIPRR
ncbi:hypothetical protein V8C37DRAFT_400020 [Trichoderma ceciliae]